LLTLDEATIKKPSLYLIDIGGGTSDTVHLEYARGDNKVISLDMGIIVMYASIQAAMESRYGRKMTETQIDDILIRGSSEYFKPEHLSLVCLEAENHVSKLLRRHQDQGVDLMSAHVVFLGGGAVLLEKQINKIAVNSIGGHTILKDIQANAKGYEIFTKTKLGW